VTSRHATLHRAVCRTLAEARRDAGLTQMALARRLGWAQSVVSRLESGQRLVGFVELVLIAEALRIDPMLLAQRTLERA
jgi:transcriptional regulator with XRE-family HTH domain